MSKNRAIQGLRPFGLPLVTLSLILPLAPASAQKLLPASGDAKSSTATTIDQAALADQSAPAIAGATQTVDTAQADPERRREMAEETIPELAATGTAWTTAEAKSICQAIASLTKEAQQDANYNTLIACCHTIDDDLETRGEEFSEKQRAYIAGVYSWALGKRSKNLIQLADQMRLVKNLEQEAIILDRVTRDLDRAIARNASNHFNYLYRGVIHARRGQLGDARLDFDKVCELAPGKTAGWFNRAELNSFQGLWQAAADDYRQVLEIAATDQPALNGLGISQMRLDRPDEALACFEKLLAIQPDSSVALINRGDAACLLERWNQAFDDYQLAAKQDSHPLAYQRAAWLLATCPDNEFFKPETAKLLLEKAKDSLGETPLILSTEAAVLAASGEYSTAKERLERARALSEQQPVPMLLSRQLQAQAESYESESVYSTNGIQ